MKAIAVLPTVLMLAGARLEPSPSGFSDAGRWLLRKALSEARLAVPAVARAVPLLRLISASQLTSGAISSIM